MKNPGFILDLDLVKIVAVESLPRLGWNDPQYCKIYWRLPDSMEVHTQVVHDSYEAVIEKIWTAQELKRN